MRSTQTWGLCAALALSASLAAQGIVIRKQEPGTPAVREATAAGETTPDSILQSVNAVMREHMKGVARPMRGASKQEIDTYRAAYGKAQEARTAAAKKALTKHEKLLSSGPGLFVRGELQTINRQNSEALASYLEYAKTSTDDERKALALFKACNLTRYYGKAPKAKNAKAILDQIDTSKLDDRMKQMLDRTASSLARDLKREELHGKPAPAITASRVIGEEAADGESFSLGQYKGKVVLVDFWATWCGPCRKVIPDLVKMQAKFGDKIKIVGATKLYGYGTDFSDPKSTIPHGGKLKRNLEEDEEIEINESFAERFELNYPIVISNAEAFTNYAIGGIPCIFVIDQKGNVVDSLVGASDENHDKLVAHVHRLLGSKPEHGTTEATGKKHTKGN